MKDKNESESSIGTYRFLAEQRVQVFRIVFGTGNTAARLFDIVLICAILLSVLLVMIGSNPSLSPAVQAALQYAVFGFTVIFTLEYLLRIFISPKPIRYMVSFFGILDLLAIMPTYLTFIFPEAGRSVLSSLCSKDRALRQEALHVPLF